MSEAPGPAGLYLHLPFCLSKCPYCDFSSEVRAPGCQQRCVEAILREASMRAADKGPFDTVYLGGGTPSVLSPDTLSSLLEGIRMRCQVDPAAEVTMEVNPDDVTPRLATLWREMGVGRVSVGVQSFDDGELRLLGRRHDATAARRALSALRERGPQNLSVDLIYGFFGQRRRTLLASIAAAFEHEPDHLSCYQLTLEPGTPFGVEYARGSLSRLSEEQERSFFLLVSDAIRCRGFEHYEISNFASGPSRRSRHNQKYWRRALTIGLGPSAHSLVGRRRSWNLRGVDAYTARVEEGRAPTDGFEELNESQIRLETLLLGLRTANGVSVDFVRSLANGERSVADLVGEGLLVVDGRRVKPTLEGYLLADGLPLRFDVETQTPCE